jgi:hypothetical protein
MTRQPQLGTVVSHADDPALLLLLEIRLKLEYLVPMRRIVRDRLLLLDPSLLEGIREGY